MNKYNYQLRAKQGGGIQRIIIEASTPSMADMMCESQYGAAFEWFRCA